MQEKLLYAINALTSRMYSAFRKHPSMVDTESVKQIVCVKLDEIGDMVTALHVFDLLKLRFPNAQITVVCKPFVGSLLSNNPSVHRVVNQLNENLRADLWVELRGTWKTWWKSLFSGAQVRVDRGSIRFKQRGNQPHETITNFRIVEPLLGAELKLNSVRAQLFLNEQEKNEVSQVCHEFGISDATKLCLIHPGGRSLLRRWPVDRFQKIIEFLEEKGFKCIVFGSVEERDLLSKFNHQNAKTVIWETKESLRVFYGVLQKAQLFVGNESGPLQLADLAGVTSVGLFGPGVERVFYPQGEKARVIHKVLPCNPCDQIHCSRYDSRCMLQITTDEVVQSILDLAK
jgi:ADP-heptose:LPS heptosyltransferase